jgi:nitrogen-specific signal transduction histidine kinase
VAPVPAIDALHRQIEALHDRVAQAEAALRTARLESALKSQLIGDVNHALRTPLVAVQGYARLLLDPRVETSEAQRRQYLEVVAHNTERMVDVAAALVVPPPAPMRFAPVDVAACWRDVVEAARAGIEARAVSLTAWPLPSPAPLIADESRLRASLAELVAGVLESAVAGDALHASWRDDGRRVALILRCTPSEPASDERTPSLRFDAVRDGAHRHGGRFVITVEEAGATYSLVIPRLVLDG